MFQRIMNVLSAFYAEARFRYRRVFKPAIINNRGILLRAKHPAISPYMRFIMYQDIYEVPELQILGRTVDPSDRILEIGGGAGFVSTFVAKKCGSQNVTVIEANPALVPLIEENHRLNAVGPRVVNAAACGDDRATESFYVSENFWSGSTAVGRDTSITVPAVNVNSLIEQLDPTYLIMDIEGAEIEIIPTLRLHNIQKILIELHPQYSGAAQANDAMVGLIEKGFVLDFARSIKNQLYLTRAENG